MRFHLSHKQYFGGEVVGVAVEEHSGRVSALGISLAVAFVVFEEVEVENFGFVEVPAVVGHVYEVAGYYNLVEEVPGALISEGADAGVEFAPPGIEETLGFNTFRFLFLRRGQQRSCGPGDRR